MKPVKTFLIIILLLIVTTQYSYSQGFLHRTGKYLYDGEGNEVILRGIGTGNWMLQEGYMMQTSDVANTQHEFRNKLIGTIGEAKTDSFYTVWLGSHFRKIDVDSMKSWGFNSIRVAMHYKWFTPPIEEEPVPGEITWLEKGFTLIDSLLDWCSKNRMYLILDLHGAPGGQGKDAAISDYDPSKPSLWESQANRNKTIALWKKLAQRYSAEPWIGGYDLINETNWTMTNSNAALWDLLKQITAAIREVDNNHLIIIEGNGFANDYTGLPVIWDNNLALSFHKYWSYNDAGSLNWIINLRNQRNVPVWLGESGENSNVWFTELIALCEKNRIGWSWWPVKKAGINNPLKVTVNDDYTKLINYWKGTAPNPGVDAAFKAVLQFAANHRLENCSFQKDVVDAMIRQPFTTETIPFKIYQTGEPVYATDYNLGRNGYAYFDNDTADYHGSTGTYTNWNQGWSYRNDGVDIEKCTDSEASNGFNVGWTGNNEWMEYTVKVDSTAGYTLDIRSASGSSGSKVHLEANGKVITPLISLPGTSGWFNWRTKTISGVILEKGTNILRFVFDQGGSNLNYFKFSAPVSTDSLKFENLYAASSTDGKSIILTLNKDITSPVEEILSTDFLVTINNQAVEISKIEIDNKNQSVLIISVTDPLYYGGTIRIGYQGNTILNKNQQLEKFSNLSVINNLPVRYNFPGRIQSENYYYNNGMVSESCTDAGGGSDMGFANPGDYMDYLVNVPVSRHYNFNFRVASERTTSQIIIRRGEGNDFTAIDTVTINSTGGWQNWKTIASTAYLPGGRYTLRIYVRSGEFNINWFETTGTPVTEIETTEIADVLVYPNPADDFISVDLSGINGNNFKIDLYNSFGQVVKSVSQPGSGKIQISISDLRKGLYMLKLSDENKLIKTAKLILK